MEKFYYKIIVKINKYDTLVAVEAPKEWENYDSLTLIEKTEEQVWLIFNTEDWSYFKEIDQNNFNGTPLKITIK